MPQRTILAPGVEIREVDESLRPELPIGTNVYVTGFTAIGPSDQTLPISSISEWESIYGLPTNASERYAYHTVKDTLKGGTAHVMFNRLPYGSNKGEGYGNAFSLLAYPVGQFISVDPFDADAAYGGAATATGSLRVAAYDVPNSVLSLHDTETGDADTLVTSNFPVSLLTSGAPAGALANGDSTVTKPLSDFATKTLAGGDTFSATELVDAVGVQVSGLYPGAITVDLFITVDGHVIGLGSDSNWYNVDSAENIVEVTGYRDGSPIYVSDPVGTFKFNSVMDVYYNESLRGVYDAGNNVISLTDKDGDVITNGTLETVTGAVAQSALIVSTVTGTNVKYPESTTGNNGETSYFSLTEADGTALTIVGATNIVLVITKEGYIVAHETVADNFYTLESVYADPATPANWSEITILGPKPKTNNGADIVSAADKIDHIIYDDALAASASDLGVPERSTYVLGKPTHVKLTKEQYDLAGRGELFEWSATASPDSNQLAADIKSDINNLGKAGVVILNDAQSVINNRFQGYYIGINDSTQVSDATDFDTLVGVSTFASNPASYVNNLFDEVVPGRLTFSLTAGADENLKSLSEVQEGIAPFLIDNDQYKDSVNVGLYKLVESTVNEDIDKLSFVLETGVVGSFDYHRKINNVNGGSSKSLFIDNVLDDSPTMTFRVNPNISQKNGNSWKGSSIVSQKRVVINTSNNTVDIPTDDAANLGYADKLFPIGYYSDNTPTNKEIGNLPVKLLRALDRVKSTEMYDIDITVEGGLGTIWTSVDNNNTKFYDDEVLTVGTRKEFDKLRDSKTISSSPVLDSYRTIFNIFNDFASLERKDHLFIADALRHILVRGKDSKTISENNNFALDVLYPLRHQFERANSSYAAVFPTWAKVRDFTSDENVWVPFSGKVARTAAESDSLRAVWESFAGLNRGIVQDVLDVAYNPNDKQQGQMYKANLNPVPIFAKEGVVIWGQKTLQRKPSAFQNINVRRLFLYVEKASARVSRYFVHEPNTLYTRTQAVNILNSILERVKQQDGVYDFRVICGKANNPASVIDNNELIIDIYIAPTRTIEFILLNFQATRTSFNFSELEQDASII